MQKGEEHNRPILDFKYLVCIRVLQLALSIKIIATITVWSLYKCKVFAYISERVWNLTFSILVEDLKINDGSAEKPYYMSDSLKSIMDLQNRPSADANDGESK